MASDLYPMARDTGPTQGQVQGTEGTQPKVRNSAQVDLVVIRSVALALNNRRSPDPRLFIREDRDSTTYSSLRPNALVEPTLSSNHTAGGQPRIAWPGHSRLSFVAWSWSQRQLPIR